jgi:hypothetical protein
VAPASLRRGGAHASLRWPGTRLHVKRRALGRSPGGESVRLAFVLAILAIEACASSGSAALHLEPATPASCVDGLRELGLAEAPDSGEFTVAYDTAYDMTSVQVLPDHPRSYAEYGVKDFISVISFHGRPPAALPFFDVDLLVWSPAPRSEEQRVVIFQLDDSVRVAMGAGWARKVPSPPDVPGVMEQILVTLPPDQAMRVLRADHVRGWIGSTAFEIPNHLHDAWRRMLLYVRCGPK